MLFNRKEEEEMNGKSIKKLVKLAIKHDFCYMNIPLLDRKDFRLMLFSNSNILGKYVSYLKFLPYNINERVSEFGLS